MKNLTDHLIVWNEKDVRVHTRGEDSEWRLSHDSSAGCAYTDIAEGDINTRVDHLLEIFNLLHTTEIPANVIAARLSVLEEWPVMMKRVHGVMGISLH